MVDDKVLEGSKYTLEIDAEVLIETFVLSIDKCPPEDGIDVFIRHWRAIFAEVLAYLHTVGTIQF